MKNRRASTIGDNGDLERTWVKPWSEVEKGSNERA